MSKSTAFVTKDSGEREKFDSGMVRDTQTGKLRYDLAFDGPVVWAAFEGTKYQTLARVSRDWYENGGSVRAGTVIKVLAAMEGGNLITVIDRYAELMMRGAIKYDEKNWMKAEGEAELARFKASFCRHWIQYVSGKVDEDHMAAQIFNMNGAEFVRNKIAKHITVPETVVDTAVEKS